MLSLACALEGHERLQKGLQIVLTVKLQFKATFAFTADDFDAITAKMQEILKEDYQFLKIYKHRDTLKNITNE